ncbi:hypothetical protein PFISCL1PPCAC_16255 [Pristionchus fissidentatus]|uniref:Uncharacterized protein n=1 Tax=Pristionchus fissidentatus TaxID=1538716 RepID=A0AAV5W3B0_9BILA|nr:hypothetical protein PFISCL1PPCAC_16255 [Pristionchus fissidentatus]
MIGLIVQVSADLVKIWSTSSRRLVSYSIHDVPEKCREGDWIDIEFDPSGVMKEIHKRESLLETRREGGGLKVRDSFIIDYNNGKAFSDNFGNVILPREREMSEKCLLLWVNIYLSRNGRAEFEIGMQPKDEIDGNEDDYGDSYWRLREEYSKMSLQYSSVDCKEPMDPNEFDETILIVGHDPRTDIYFTSSRCGEAVIERGMSRDRSDVEKGAVFRACIRRGARNTNIHHRVSALYERIDGWEGVDVRILGKDIKVALDGVIMERRTNCCVLETVPFGPVTYPLDKSCPPDVKVGDRMRVTVLRYKSDMKDDYPSKWQVTEILSRNNEEEWREGIVTSIVDSRHFISFACGNAEYNKKEGRGPNLALGDVVDICVVDTGNASHFNVVQIDSNIRRRQDITVQSNELNKINVFCRAEVVERTKSYFLLYTPIIGDVLFFHNEAPVEMRIGQVWEVKMLRRKDKQDLPSHWVATAVTSMYPRESRESTDDEWTTVIITGRHALGTWYASCPSIDSIRIRSNLHVGAAEFERGAFYRIKFAMEENGNYYAIDMDPDPVYPRDIEMVKSETLLQFWCYSKIVEERAADFTVRNELIGEAILPFKRAKNGMRVGVELETLYYLVRNTNNPTHWMVMTASIASRRRDDRDERRWRDGEQEEERREKYERRQEYHEDGIGRRKERYENRSVSDIQSNNERARDWDDGVVDGEKKRNNRVKTDRRVLEAMREFMKNGMVREKIETVAPESFAEIIRILDNDRKM